MKNNSASNNQLNIREFPFTSLISGVIMLLAAGGVNRFFPKFGLQNALFLAVFGVVLILISQITTISADKTTGILAIKKRRLFFFVSTQEIPLIDVKDCQVQSKRSYDSDHPGRGSHSNYRLVIVKKSGEIVPVHSWYTNGYKHKAQIVRRLADFLGLEGAEDKPTNLLQSAMQAQVAHTRVLEGFAQAAAVPATQMQQRGVTSGVTWSIERHTVGPQKVTRWICSNFAWQGQFLLILQKPKGTASSAGGIKEGLGKMILQQVISMYGFLPGDLPGFANASNLPPNPQLDSDFSCLSSAPGVVSGVMNVWVISALQRWAQCHPMQTVTRPGEMGQLAVLLSPRGTYLSILYDPSQAQLDELIDLGVEIVRNQAGFQVSPQ